MKTGTPRRQAEPAFTTQHGDLPTTQHSTALAPHKEDAHSIYGEGRADGLGEVHNA